MTFLTKPRISILEFLFITFLSSILTECTRGNAAELATTSLIKIAIIDTGYAGTSLKLCSTGHWDFETQTATVTDRNGHGTRVGNIIAQDLEGLDYCVVVLSVRLNGDILQFMEAYSRAEKAGAKYINISMSGSSGFSMEAQALQEITERSNIRVFAAAGNNNKDLDQGCDVFPACYYVRKLYAVGAMCSRPVSNYGKVIDIWSDGDYGHECATSYATPRALAAYIRNKDLLEKLKLPSKQRRKPTTDTAT